MAMKALDSCRYVSIGSISPRVRILNFLNGSCDHLPSLQSCKPYGNSFQSSGDILDVAFSCVLTSTYRSPISSVTFSACKYRIIHTPIFRIQMPNTYMYIASSLSESTTEMFGRRRISLSYVLFPCKQPQWSSFVPQLSQLLYYENGMFSSPVLSSFLNVLVGTVYNQTLILNNRYEVDPVLVSKQGLPYYAATWVICLFAWNLGVGATFTHLLLWNHNDLRAAWSWMTLSDITNMWSNFNWKFWEDNGARRQIDNEEDTNPHYHAMLKVCVFNVFLASIARVNNL